MKLQEGTEFTRRRFLYLFGALGALGLVGIAGCGGPKQAQQPTAQQEPPEQKQPEQPIDLGTLTVALYRSPTCSCCKEYDKYLGANGFTVQSTVTEDMNSIKNSFDIPEKMWSCHTMKVGRYFVEGHVPIEAIQKLLKEQREIDGIALPGMPSGSPGMGGIKTEPFVVYAITQGQTEEFIKI